MGVPKALQSLRDIKETVAPESKVMVNRVPPLEFTSIVMLGTDFIVARVKGK